MRRPRFALLCALAAVALTRRSWGADDDVDVRLPLRVGWGYAAAYPAPALSVGASSEIEGRVSKVVGISLGTDVEGVTVYDPRAPDRARGFFSIGLVFGLFFRTPTIGPAISLALPLAIDARDQDVVGVGIGARATLYPYYHSLIDSLSCERGPFAAYVASSVFVWTGVRLDTTDESKGATVSFGAGLDLSRLVLLPMIAWAFRQGCSKSRPGESLFK